MIVRFAMEKSARQGSNAPYRYDSIQKFMSCSWCLFYSKINFYKINVKQLNIGFPSYVLTIQKYNVCYSLKLFVYNIYAQAALVDR